MVGRIAHRCSQKHGPFGTPSHGHAVSVLLEDLFGEEGGASVAWGRTLHWN